MTPSVDLPSVETSAFIRANTRLRPVPHAPEIVLYVADEATELWQKTEDELDAIGLPPPFWAFAWAGGQALARHILDRPELVTGQRVLDFASGSGLVAIAAILAGATHAVASDLDAFAIAAIGLNADANGVAGRVTPVRDDLIGTAPAALGATVILVADIFYERDIASRVTDWLAGLHQAGATILIGDPGRSYLPRDRLDVLATYEVPVSRSLEDAEIKRSSVWRFRD